MTLPTEGQPGHLQKHADIDTLIAGHTSQIAAGDVTNPASAAGVALSATFAAQAVSPRDTRRVLLERKPVLLIDRIAPNANHSHKIVWADGDTLYGYGIDYSLRKSLDKGATWGKALSTSTAVAIWAKQGLFFKTAAGSLITTSDPSSLAEPKIIRSTDDGATWADVVPAQANVLYLGVTNIGQDPITGYLYLAEYVTALATVKATFNISRSIDDGATWSTFHTFQRDAGAYPATAVRHGHAVQWDQFSQRIYFACGDSEQSAGIYRVNAGGSDVEPVLVRSQLPADIWAGAVGIMFFPNYIAWGIDQSSDSSLVRMNRNQIGTATPVVEKMGRLQATAWYTCRVASNGTEWLMCVSNEVSVGRVDAAMHIYRVADDAATLDEVLTIPTPGDASISRAYPVGSPLQNGTLGVVWLGTNAGMAYSGQGTLARGQQFAAMIGWGGAPLQQTNSDRPMFFAPVTQSSGNANLTPLEKRFFGVAEVPTGATRLYIIEVGREMYSGTGFPYVEVWNQTAAAILKMEDNTTLMQWQNRSLRAAKNEASAPYLFRSGLLSPGTQIRFRLDEVSNAAAECSGYITYAWGL